MIKSSEQVTVTLAPGEYRMTGTLAFGKEDSGAADAPVVWRAEKPGTVSIVGGITIEDIARARDMELCELIEDIESIVNSGTRLNIDYYIKQTIDEDKIDDIFTYFKEEAQSDSVTDAMKELGHDYEEEEVRLVRIKFLSELGN